MFLESLSSHACRKIDTGCLLGSCPGVFLTYESVLATRFCGGLEQSMSRFWFAVHLKGPGGPRVSRLL